MKSHVNQPFNVQGSMVACMVPASNPHQPNHAWPNSMGSLQAWKMMLAPLASIISIIGGLFLHFWVSPALNGLSHYAAQGPLAGFVAKAGFGPACGFMMLFG